MKFPEKLLGDWNNLDIQKLSYPTGKYVNRSLSLKSTWRYLSGIKCRLKAGMGLKQKVIDIGAGGGAALEIFKHFGYNVLAVDRYDIRSGTDYDKMLISQKIHHIHHDCSKIPYPFKDQSFDILLSMGSIINIVSGDHTKIPIILNEFSRITKKTIFLVVNRGPHLDRGKRIIQTWKSDFKLTYTNNNNVFRWDKR